MLLARAVAVASAAALLLAGLAAPSQARPAPPAESSQVVLDWEVTAFTTIYPAPTTPIPVNVPLLGYTSLAMYEAAVAAERRRVSQVAAVATAAHDVLVHHVPGRAADLDAALVASLATVPDGRAQERGEAVGARVAHRLITSRAHDGLGDQSIVYARDAAPGVWQPESTPMLGAWIGFMRPLVVRNAVRLVDGPDTLTSSAYATDYAEVKALGARTGSTRGEDQTATADFFNFNSATMVGDALVDHLRAHPLGLTETARIFAAMHVAMTDTLIACFRLKYDVAFWRPSQAIAGAATDGNPATEPQAGWAPFLNNPPYADYPSGHGCLTAPAVETIRQTLGEATSLVLTNTRRVEDRRFADLRSLEAAALDSRIWGGLHFRDAMDDSYTLGHQVADRVLARLR